MMRAEIILSSIRREGLGLEIGPSHSPIAPKRDGFRVHVLDHLDKTGLIEKYRSHEVVLENIEEVDFIWDGRPFAELVGAEKIYDWIIASHVIEHSTDLIGFLNGCDAILKDDGVLSLAVPDARFCFDHFRPISGLGRVIDAAERPRKFHSAGMAAEYFLNVVTCGGQIAWIHGYDGEFTLRESFEAAQNAMREVQTQEVYLDIHEWCFTPSSFRLLLRDLFELGFIKLKESSFHPSLGCEFFITLSRTGTPIPGTRLELLQRILEEQAEALVKS